MSELCKATFGAGCFWHVEEAYRTVEGVVSTRVGFMGGRTENPTYKEVCTDTTGHAEVVEVTYDPEQVTYHQLLELFWDNHNPTQLNRQGPDVGSQYRSVIFYYDDKQAAEARASREKWDRSTRFSSPIVTRVESAKTFYEAEAYHQQYIAKGGSCSV